MWTALGTALPLATGLALSPAAVITGVILLLSPRGRTKAALFALGWFVAILVIATIAFLVVEVAEQVSEEYTSDGLDLVQLGFGILFLVLTALSWRKRPPKGEVPPRSKLLERLDRISTIGALGMGLAQGVIVIKNIPLALSAGALLGAAGLLGVGAVGALVVFALVSAAGILVPLAGAVIGGKNFSAPLESARVWLEHNMTPITITVLLIMAMFFLGQGLGLVD
ncbi:MAG: GAP family protein [Propionibacteriaceae bacterium]